MSQAELNPTQRSALIAIDFKAMTVMATSQYLKIDRALAANLLNQLVELGYAKKYDNGQFTSITAGKEYLRAKLEKSPKIKAQQSSRPKITVELIDVDTDKALKPGDDLYQMLAAAPAQNLSENIEKPLVLDPAEELEAAPVVVRAETETNAIVTQLQPSKPALPLEIESSLLKLEKLLEVQPFKPLPDIDTKLQVLRRLADLLHPTIADVLDAIADDLQRVQQVAVDVSQAA